MRYQMLLLLLINPVAWAQRHPQPGHPASSFETATLRRDWSAVVKAADTDRSLDPVAVKFVKAHALLALNRINDSVCMFASLMGPGYGSRWEMWARSFSSRHPDSAIGYYFLGDAFARLGRWSEAFQAFQTALDHNPKSAVILNARGVAYAVNGDLSQALVDLQSATAADKLLADAYVSKGYVYIQNHVAVGAQAAFDHALQLTPNAALAKSGRGYVEVIESKWTQSKQDIRAAGSSCSCLSPMFATNLASVVEWRDQNSRFHLASLKDEDLGTTLRSVLMRVGQGDASAVQEAINFGADHPEYQKKIQMTFQSMSQTSPTAKAVLGQAINDFSLQAQQRVDQLGVAQGLTVNGQVGADANVGVGKVSGQIGVTADLGKSLDQQTQQANQSLQFAQTLQNSVPAASDQLGGVTTSMVRAAIDRGDWPIRPQYTLMYSRDSRQRSEGRR